MRIAIDIAVTAVALVLIAPALLALFDGWAWIMLGHTWTRMVWDADRTPLALLMLWVAFAITFLRVMTR